MKINLLYNNIMKSFFFAIFFIILSLNISYADECKILPDIDYRVEDIITLDYEKEDKTFNVFELQISETNYQKPANTIKDAINFQTESMIVNFSSSKSNNTSTIDASFFLKPLKIKGQEKSTASFGYGFKTKEYLPLFDTTNYTLLTTNLYSKYSVGKFSLEGEVGQNLNLHTQKDYTRIGFGQKYRLNKNLEIGSKIYKNIGDDALLNEISLSVTPQKNKNNFYIEFYASTKNDEYEILQRRFEIFTKFKI